MSEDCDFDLDYSSDEDNKNDEMFQKDDKMDAEDDEPEFEATVDEFLNEEMDNETDSSDKYKILGVDQIVDLMNDSLSEVMEVIDLPNNLIRILLNHFNWDKNKLLEQYFDGNKEKLLTDAHIIDPNVVIKSAKKRRKIEMCLICYDEVGQQDMTSISCGHEFCILCWRQYLTNKIMSEGICTAISCAHNGCDIIVDDNTITSIIEDPKVIDRYRYLITNSFVASNRFLRWCPTPDCFTAIKVENYIEFIPVKCKCSSVFCFICGERWHEPTRCNVLKSWNKKCLGESGEKIDCETANWILSYTKECPKCKAAIEKNGGCNHMTCRNLQCRFEFCWICLSDWSKHGYQQSCNKYEESKETQTARARLQRYIHYWTRFHNHQQSLNSEKKQFSEVKLKMDELQLRNMTWVEVQFLKNAFTTLCKCRQTLMYTYPFAYYLQKNNQTLIFEDNQSNLEVTVEKLSELMEKDLTEVFDVKKLKTEILDISRFCENRRKVLVNHVIEGYDNDLWEFEHLD